MVQYLTSTAKETVLRLVCVYNHFRVKITIFIDNKCSVHGEQMLNKSVVRTF